jgi:serine/threonine protein kinase
MHAGARLGSYEIVSAIGAGGMGEVYRARHLFSVVLVLSLCSASPVLAQRSDRATITGVVTDTQGLAVAGADVTVRNQSTGVETDKTRMRPAHTPPCPSCSALTSWR